MICTSELRSRIEGVGLNALKFMKDNSRSQNGLFPRAGRVGLVSIIACGIFHICFPCYGQGRLQPLHITFDGLPTMLPGTAISVLSYSEAGIVFRPVGPSGPGNTFTRHGGGISTSPDNSTAYLRAGFGQSLMFSFSDGSLFNLDAVDLAEYSTVVSDAVTVHFVGYRFDGSVVTTDFTTDGIIDGTGPLADFQTFNFQDFTGLTRVEIPTDGWSLDNLMVSQMVPEPTTTALLLIGGLTVFTLRLRRKS
jgi:hypothetical protein